MSDTILALIFFSISLPVFMVFRSWLKFDEIRKINHEIEEEENVWAEYIASDEEDASLKNLWHGLGSDKAN